MHRADLLSPSCFALTNVFAGSARCPRSILSSVRATVHSQRQECQSRHRTGNGWGSEGSPQPLSTGGLWGNEVLSPSMSPPQLAEMEMQQGNLASPDCSRVPQHLQGVSAEGRGWALRRLPRPFCLKILPGKPQGCFSLAQHSVRRVGTSESAALYRDTRKDRVLRESIWLHFAMLQRRSKSPPKSPTL